MRAISGTTTTADGDWAGDLTTEPRVVEFVGQATGTNPLAATWTQLTHGTGHYVVGADDHGLLGRGDALVTDRPGVVLAIRTADCVPVFVTGQRSVVLLHAGMAGAVQGILPHLVSIMATEFSEEVGSLRVRLGPHICNRCYEVSQGNATYLKGFPAATQYVKEDNGKRTFDLAAILGDQTTALGITDFDPAAACTLHDPEPGHFSARRGDGTQRILSYLMLAPADDA